MLPVVRVPADIQEPRGCHVLFEIVVVEVHAPPVGVAARARVDVVVVEVGRVVAVGGEGDEVVREALDEGARGGDGGDVVAAVGVEVEEGLEAEVERGGVLREGEGRGGGGLPEGQGGGEGEGEEGEKSGGESKLRHGYGGCPKRVLQKRAWGARGRAVLSGMDDINTMAAMSWKRGSPTDTGLVLPV